MRLLLILTPLFLISCGRGYKLTELYEQEINNSTKHIIKYGSWSNLNVGAKYGYAIMQKGDSISIREIEQMHFDIFSSIPNQDTLSIIRLKDGGDKIPEFHSTTYANYKDFILRTDFYNYSVGSNCNLSYNFSDFRETKDSLIIIGIEKIDFNLATSYNRISFLKGNIKLIESDSIIGCLEQISIPALLLPKYIGGKLDNQTIIKDSSMYITGLVNFNFFPKKKIMTHEFSNSGFYKVRLIENVDYIK